MHRKVVDLLYPSFRREAIDAVSGDSSPHWILNFPFRVRGKREDDLVVFGLGKSDRPSEIALYENPRNKDFDDGVEDDSELERWTRLALQLARLPSSSVPVDISGNGFLDLIVTSDYGDSLDQMDPYGGCICWLENFGTGEGDWTRRDIGRFPGVNCVKVGHFSTTFSLQVLAVVTSLHSEICAPLIVFTRPADVYKSRHWLVNIALENTFSAIQDCHVVSGAVGSLDHVLISSREGLSMVWYDERSWHRKTICCVDNFDHKFLPGKVSVGRARRDRIAYIVVAEASKGSVLSLYTKKESSVPVHDLSDIDWSHSVLDDFTDDESRASILDLLCVDVNGDGMDEIIVSVWSSGSKDGIYCYVQEGGRFVKYKLSDEAAIKITPGRFAARDKIDLATLSRSLPREIAIHYHSYVSSQIKPFIEGSELIFSVHRSPSSVCEVDVIDTAGYILSLVLLPPNASFNVASDGTEAVKVLYGALGWIDSLSELIERSRAAGLPGCVTTMLVDSPEGHVRSGNDGAVFVRMRPSCATGNANLQSVNVLPSHFPCEVCDFKFVWLPAREQPWFPQDGENSSTKDLFHLTGFHVRFGDAGSQRLCSDGSPHTDIAYVHFWTAAPGVSSGFVRNNVSPWAPKCSSASTLESDAGRVQRREATTCAIRASLSNPGGDGGLLYCADRLDWGTTPPTPFQIARARKMVLPVMYEHAPFWRVSSTDGADGETGADVDVDYPWHAWIAGGVRRKGRMKWDVWVSFDFPAFVLQQNPQSNDCNCAIC